MRDNFLKILESRESINDRYRKVQRISPNGGDGHFSLLLTAEDSQTGKTVALKFYDLTKQDAYRQACFERESQILLRLKGEPNVLQVVDAAQNYEYDSIDAKTGLQITIPFRFFVTDIARSSVFDFIYRSDKNNALKNLECFREICKGVRRVHSKGFCHRDLKPPNCLVLPNKSIVISDFGTAKSLDGSIPSPPISYEGPVGDLMYTAPELLCRLDFDNRFWYAADMYSLGGILFEMFAKTPLNQLLYSDGQVLFQMIAAFGAIREQNRQKVFEETIGTFSANNPLPDLFECAPEGVIPESIRVKLDRLYKDLASLDCRTRLTSFDSMLNQLNIMTIRLKRDLVRERWHRYKEYLRRRKEESSQISQG